MRILEACIESVTSAVAAEKGGAKRVELCGNLIEGGTTPSTGMVQAVQAHSSLPIYDDDTPKGRGFSIFPVGNGRYGIRYRGS